MILPVIYYYQTHLTHALYLRYGIGSVLMLLYLRCCGIVDLRYGSCGIVEIKSLLPWH